MAAAALVLFGFDPGTSGFFPPCPFHWATGFYCPGCGSLRALHQLLHGRIPAAFGLNPLLVLSLPGLVLLRFRPQWVYRPWVAWFALALLVAYGMLRNIPCAPFTSLAPG